MKTTWLLTREYRSKTGRVGRIFNFVEGRMTLDVSETRIQLVDNQLCRYYGAVRMGTMTYFDAVRKHFMPGGHSGKVLNEKWIPEEHRRAAEAPANVQGEDPEAGSGVQDVLPVTTQGAEHASARGSEGGNPSEGWGIHGQPDLSATQEAPHSELRGAVMALDPGIGELWTSTGLPRIEVLEAGLGWKPTRSQIETAAPSHTREVARAMKTIEG